MLAGGDANMKENVEGAQKRVKGSNSGGAIDWQAMAFGPQGMATQQHCSTQQHVQAPNAPLGRVQQQVAYAFTARNSSVPDLRRLRTGGANRAACGTADEQNSPWPHKGNPLTRRRKSELLHIPDKFQLFPDDVMLSVFDWLPKRTLARCSLVSRKWYKLAMNSSLWKRIDLGGKNLSESSLHRIINRGAMYLRLARAELTLDLCVSDVGGQLLPMNTQCRITHLDLSCATYTDPTFVTAIIERCRFLECLSLEMGLVDERTCVKIGNNPRMTHLNMAMCRGVNDKGLKHIVLGCQKLLEVNLAWTNLTSEGVAHLCNNLAPTAMRLNISGCRETALVDQDVKKLAYRCRSLRELDVSDCSKVTGTTVDLMMSLPHFDTLCSSRCYAIEPICYTTVTKLKHLNIHGCVHDDGVLILKQKLPKCLINEQHFSTIARPTVGIRRTSIWQHRVRDE